MPPDQVPTHPLTVSLSFLADGGEMGALMRAHDWSTSPLGLPENWPQSLRSVVGLMLTSKFPMFVAWGPELAFLYNDGYRPIFGAKHPHALGLPFAQVWSDIWLEIEPLVTRALAGEATFHENLHLLMERNGYPEDTWYTFSYSPVRDESGAVAGMFCACTETTDKVLAERRNIAEREQLQQLFEQAPGFMAMLRGPEHVFELVNPAYMQLIGHRDVIGKPVREALPEITGQGFFELLDEVHASGNAFKGTALKVGLQRTPGSAVEERFVDLVYQPVTDSEGRVTGIFAEGSDVTERVHAEAALRESEAHYRHAAELNPQVAWTATPDGQLDRVAERWQIWTGTSGLGDSWGQGLHADDLAPTVEAWVRSVTTGVPYDIEHRVKMLSGGYRWARSRAFPRRGADGRIVKWYGSTEDIHERKLAEQGLRESEERFRNMADHAPVMMWVTDPTGYCTYLNQRWYEFTGQREDDALGFGWTRATHPDDQKRAEDAFLSANAQQVPFRIEYRLRRADGAYRWAIDAASPRFGPAGEFLGYVGSVIDIDERREMEQRLRELNDTLEERVEARTRELQAAEEALRQAQKMEAVGQLTGGIAHDFNNLLAGIVGSLDLMQMRIAQGRTDTLERYAKAAMSSAQRAAALTHRLLAFARRQPLDPKLVDANQLVTSMEDLLRRSIGPLHALEIVTAGGLWTTLCDPNQLESAILNLAINARDAMPDGGKLTIETANAHLDDAYAAASRDVTPGQYVCICITDTGTGMPPDIVARAFEPFFTTKPLGQGTGLGLSMVYGFAKQSEGHLKIYSEIGRGTTVKIYLPRHRGVADEDEPIDSATEALPAEAGETVLVVEDEPVIRDLLVEVLQDRGYRTLEAADGPSGLRILQSQRRIDLLVTDVGLPGLNGRQLADQAREKRPELKVLFITGYAENATLANGFLDPGMEMITKPFAVETLATKVRSMIRDG